MKKEKEKKKKKLRRIPGTPPDKSDRAKTPDPLFLFNKLLGGKWKMRILWVLRDETGKRYGQIKTSVEGITDMMLSQSLRQLCDDGLVARRQFQEIPPRVEYQITQRALGVLPALELLARWAADAAEF